MKYDKRSVTDAGADLLAHSLQEEKKTVIDYLVVTDNRVSDSTDVKSVQLSDFGNYLSFPVAYIKNPDAKTFQPGAVMSNYDVPTANSSTSYLNNIHNDANGNQVGDLSNPLTVNMVGVIGHTDGENNSSLITVAVANDNEAMVIPSKTDIPYSLTFDFAVKMENDDDVQNITIAISPTGMVTEEEFHDAIDKLKEVGQLTDNDDVFNLPENGHYTINGTNPKNNPWGKQIWADVYRTAYNTIARDNVGDQYISNGHGGWSTILTTDNLGDISSQMSSAAQSNANATQSVANSIGTWLVSGFDSVGGSNAYLNAQNNERIIEVASLADAVKYSYIKELGNDDDILHLPENGHYVIRGANPANNPWGKNIWADVYRTDYQTIVRDNTGNTFVRSQFDSTWKFLLNNLDRDNLQSQINSLAAEGNGNSLANSLSSSTNTDVASLSAVDSSLANQIVANESYTSSTAISLADSLGGYDSWLSTSADQGIQSTNSNATSLANSAYGAAVNTANGYTDSVGNQQFQNAVNVAKNYAVQDNHDGTVTFNGEKLALRGLIDPNADLFNLPEPGIYQSIWGYQSTLKNFPSGDGAATIIATNTKSGANQYGGKIYVFDSWGNEYQSLWGNSQFNAWRSPAYKDDINPKTLPSNDLDNVTEQGIYPILDNTNINNFPLKDKYKGQVTMLSVTNDGYNDIYQTITVVSSNDVYMRSKTSYLGFDDWKKQGLVRIPLQTGLQSTNGGTTYNSFGAVQAFYGVHEKRIYLSGFTMINDDGAEVTIDLSNLINAIGKPQITVPYSFMNYIDGLNVTSNGSTVSDTITIGFRKQGNFSLDHCYFDITY